MLLPTVLFVACKRAQEKFYSACKHMQSGVTGHNHDCIIGVLFCNFFSLKHLNSLIRKTHHLKSSF